MTRPLVTTVIPSFNHARYIRTAIESVLNQTYENIELIVVDDGSKDESHSIIREYQGHPKVKMILNAENRGQSAVFNQALAIAGGKYVALLPSDDWFLPEKIALQVAKMESCDDDVGVVYAAGARYFEDTGETVTVNLPVRTGWIARDLIEIGNFIYPVTPLYRRAVFDKVRPSEQFKAEGEAIHLRIALQYRYEYVDEIVAVMRDHSYNIGKDAAVILDEVVKHREWFFNLPDLPDEIREMKNKSLVRLFRIKAMQLIFDRGDPKKGRECIAKAIYLDPGIIAKHPKILIAYFASYFPNSYLRLVRAARTSTGS